nr:unnamed protein product [Callosobruchus chinensis]
MSITQTDCGRSCHVRIYHTLYSLVEAEVHSKQWASTFWYLLPYWRF